MKYIFLFFFMKNELNNNRVMFQIVCGINKDVTIFDGRKIHNSELNEKTWCKETEYKQEWCHKLL